MEERERMKIGLTAYLIVLIFAAFIPFAMIFFCLPENKKQCDIQYGIRKKTFLLACVIVFLIFLLGNLWHYGNRLSYHYSRFLQMKWSGKDAEFLLLMCMICVCSVLPVTYLLRKLFKCSFAFSSNFHAIVVLLMTSIFCALLGWKIHADSLNDLSMIILKDGCVTVQIHSGFGLEKETVYLSGNQKDLHGIRFADLTIEAGGTCDLAVSFKELGISDCAKSVLCLSDEQGTLLDSLEVPPFRDGMIYELTDEGWIMKQLPDPEGYTAISAPVFSKESGFYPEAFELHLSAAEGSVIHYSLDGSKPDQDSPIYKDAISIYDRSNEENRFRNIRNVVLDYEHAEEQGKEPVDKAFIVRAIAFDTQGNCSDIVTKTYFIGLEQYRDLDIISLIADPDDLFDPEQGIYVTGKTYDEWYEKYLNGNQDDSDEPIPNYLKKGREWEREASMTFFEKGNVSLQQEVGIRIQGNATRRNPLKRFSIYARKEYGGSRYFDRDLLQNGKIHSLFLRDGQLHALSQVLAADRHVLTSPFRKVTVFLNGEYWYDTYLYEKATEHYISKTYHVHEDDVAIYKNNEINELIEMGDHPFSAIHEYLDTHDLSKKEDFNGLDEILDIQSYIDSMCIQTYLLNLDYRERGNNYYWHTINEGTGEYADSRWRLGLIDLDLAWGFAPEEVRENGHYYEVDPFVYFGKWQYRPITQWPIFSTLRKSDLFCQKFVVNMMDLINTDFSPEHVLPLLKDFELDEPIYQDFFRHRPEYMISFLKQEFALQGNIETLNVRINDTRAGKVIVNAGEIDLSSGTWEGQYFTDYPVTLSVNEMPDHDFSYWEIDGRIVKEETVEVAIKENGSSIKVVFRHR